MELAQALLNKPMIHGGIFGQEVLQDMQEDKV